MRGAKRMRMKERLNMREAKRKRERDIMKLRKGKYYKLLIMIINYGRFIMLDNICLLSLILTKLQALQNFRMNYSHKSCVIKAFIINTGKTLAFIDYGINYSSEVVLCKPLALIWKSPLACYATKLIFGLNDSKTRFRLTKTLADETHN